MKKKSRLSFHTILPGLFCAFVLFVFAPVDMYLSTADELWFSLKDLIPWLLIFAAVTFAGITLLCCILPKKLSVIFRAGVYACSFLLWLQGNVLVADYGTLDGEKVNWAEYRVPGILNALIWIAVIALFIFLMLRLRKKFRGVVEAAACILLATQIVTLGVLLIRQPQKAEQQGDRYLSRENEFVISPEENTLVFVLDCFDGNLMTTLLEEYPEDTSDKFPDFTFYPDTVAAAARTKYAIPFILTGDTNREEQSYNEYLSRAYGASPLMQELATGKYSTGFYTIQQYMDLSRDDAVENIYDGTPKPLSLFGLTKQFMKLVAFRYAPSILAPNFWMYTGDFEYWKNTDANAGYRIDDDMFFMQLLEEGLKAEAKKPAFRFYHLKGAHSPYILDRKAAPVDEEGGTEEEQALGALYIVTEYMRQLKDLGLYDRATVIVMADHGYGAHSNMEHCPLFMVKLPGESHDFAVSDMPFSQASMADLLTHAVKGQLTSLEAWRSEGKRYFYSSREHEGIIDLSEYVIDSPGIGKDVEPTGVVYHGDTLNRSRDYTLGTVLYFNGRDTGRSCIVSGFSANEGYYTWTSGHDAEMLFEFTETPLGDLEMLLDHGTFNGEQTVEVWVNEEKIETYYAYGDGYYSVGIPAGMTDGNVLRVRLHLPDANSPSALGTGDDGRLLGLSMRSIVIRNAEE